MKSKEKMLTLTPEQIMIAFVAIGASVKNVAQSTTPMVVQIATTELYAKLCREYEGARDNCSAEFLKSIGFVEQTPDVDQTNEQLQ